MRSSNRKGNRRAGQSLIETCLAVMMIGLIFAGLVQISQLFAANEILQHAALCAARAKIVGFNDWMVTKSMRVAAIPNSGKMLVPDFQNVNSALEQAVSQDTPGGLWRYALGSTPSSAQYAIEAARIPSYLESWDEGRAEAELDYSYWHSNTVTKTVEGEALSSGDSSEGSPMIHVNVTQDYPLWVPMHQAFYAADTMQLSADSYLENHYPLYIDDQGL